MSGYIAFTDFDYKKLIELIDTSASPLRTLLREELARGQVFCAKKIPRSLITMNSTVKYRDMVTGYIEKITLVYPWDVDVAAGKISILSPLGIALIGLSAGQDIYWRAPHGVRLQIRVLKVEYQPEASGHWGA